MTERTPFFKTFVAVETPSVGRGTVSVELTTFIFFLTVQWDLLVDFWLLTWCRSVSREMLRSTIIL